MNTNEKIAMFLSQFRSKKTPDNIYHENIGHVARVKTIMPDQPATFNEVFENTIKNRKLKNMKQVITIAMLAFGMSATAQIQVEKAGDSQKIFYSMTRTQSIYQDVLDQDTVYTLFYKNARYQHLTDIRTIKFEDKAELKQWLDLAEKVIDEKETFVITLASGETMKMKKQLRSCTIITTEGWLYFDYKNIEKVRNAINQ